MRRSPPRAARRAAGELALEVVEPGEHAVGGRPHARDVVAGLLARVARSSAARARRPRGSRRTCSECLPQHAAGRACGRCLELRRRRDAGARPPPPGRSRGARWGSRDARSDRDPRSRRIGRAPGTTEAELTRQGHGATSPSRSRPASVALQPGGPVHRRFLAREQRRHDPAARPAVGVLEAHRRRPTARRAHGCGPVQPAATGHASHAGARGRQTVAPSSIIAWLNVAARPDGSSVAARAASSRGDRADPVAAREHPPDVGVDGRDLRGPTRTTTTAAAVYGPTPGQRRSGPSGQPLGPPRARGVAQRQRAPVVAEPAPGRQHVPRGRGRRAPTRRGTARASARSTGPRAAPGSAGASPRDTSSAYGSRVARHGSGRRTRVVPREQRVGVHRGGR